MKKNLYSRGNTAKEIMSSYHIIGRKKSHNENITLCGMWFIQKKVQPIYKRYEICGKKRVPSKNKGTTIIGMLYTNQS